MRFLIVAFVFTILAWPLSAEEMTVDGSSKEAYERSIKAMVDRLPDEDKEAFGRGLINLIITRYPPAQGAEGLAMLQFMEPAMEAAHVTLSGVSRDDIVSKGREIMAKEAAKEAALENDPSDVLRSCLQRKVVVSNAAIERGDYGRNIKLDVTNNLHWAIAGIRVEYVAMSAGRSVPWQKDDLSVSIRGGIEPGETRSIQTSASLFPGDAPDELLTTVTVLDVSDPLERQLVRDVTVIGWAEEKSPMSCE